MATKRMYEVQSAFRYFLVTWVEEGEAKEHRFSMGQAALAFVVLMEGRGFEVELTRVTDRV
jgi:hypothetical protein